MNEKYWLFLFRIGCEMYLIGLFLYLSFPWSVKIIEAGTCLLNFGIQFFLETNSNLEHEKVCKNSNCFIWDNLFDKRFLERW